MVGGERQLLATVALPAEGFQLQAGVTRPCPCPHSFGPLLFSASCCLLWQPARSQDLTASFLSCPLGPGAQGPGGKKDVANQKVQRRNKAGVEDGKQGVPVPGLFRVPGLSYLICKTGLVTPLLTQGRH